MPEIEAWKPDSQVGFFHAIFVSKIKKSKIFYNKNINGDLEMKVILIIFLRKILVFDRLILTVSPCVADILCLYPNISVEKQKKATRTDWRHEFG